mmetsp:Transcript_3891/g.10165  ORF Transcript_3891/g.10165 Transcript_3891/m.10165 type:complete len:237 (-) Transcript_3891:1276-1986(-)
MPSGWSVLCPYGCQYCETFWLLCWSIVRPCRVQRLAAKGMKGEDPARAHVLREEELALLSQLHLHCVHCRNESLDRELLADRVDHAFGPVHNVFALCAGCAFVARALYLLETRLDVDLHARLECLVRDIVETRVGQTAGRPPKRLEGHEPSGATVLFAVALDECSLVTGSLCHDDKVGAHDARHFFVPRDAVGRTFRDPLTEGAQCVHVFHGAHAHADLYLLEFKRAARAGHRLVR